MKFSRCACIEPLYSELPFLERFQAAKDDGFDFVEFWSWTDKDLDAVKDAAGKAGISIAGFNGDAELSMIDPDTKGPTSTLSANPLPQPRRWAPAASPSTPTALGTADW